MKVLKRNGELETFKVNKVLEAVTKAYEANKREVNNEVIEEINSLPLTFSGDTISVETIQNEVIKILMDLAPYDVALSYILYREKHKNIREYAEKKIKFIENFAKSSNTANATIDDNSNVSTNNIAVLNSEIHKEDNQQVNYRILENKVRKLYPDFDYKQMLKDFNSIAYLHDSSSQIGMPYTYSSREVVEVLYNGENLILPLDLLYSIVNSEEELVDADNDVHWKRPWHLYVKDWNNHYTKVTHITKKKRHRDLVRVKTAFGEDIVVTDNHPLITDISDINNSTEAINSLGELQYKVGTTLSFKGKDVIDLVSILPSWIEYGDKYIKIPNGNSMKRFIPLDRNLGYIVGFFIGDGGYNNTSKYLDFSQKEKDVLVDINNKVFDLFGFTFKINKDSQHDNKYLYTIRNCYVYELFRNYFKIQDKAQNKTLPINILEFNEDFAKGVLEGLIDSDGTVKQEDCTINIRLSSRAAILQCTALFRHFNYAIGNSIQSLPFSNNSSYKTNYTIWGINATKRDNSEELNGSSKVRNNLINSKSKSLKYHSTGECAITKVDKIEEESSFLALNEYIYDITTETHTFELNNILVHNCVAITMYPFLLNGLKDIGGLSAAPKNIDSFCGMFINLVFAIASQFKGAVATPGMLLCMDWFLRKEFGEDYNKKLDTYINSDCCKTKKTLIYQIHQYFQQICYSLMQPSGSRGNQACFWNLSIFDKPFYDTMYSDFKFPDGTPPNWESFNWLQKDFLHWLNQERLKCVLTFPVVSACLIYQNGEFLDKELYEYLCQEYAEGNSFFTYISDSADSLSSCCRLSSKLSKPQFTFTNGQLSEMTGSKNVITLNFNRIIQDWVNNSFPSDCWVNCVLSDKHNGYPSLKNYIRTILDRVYKYQIAYNECLKDLYDSNLLTVYKAGFIDMKKQYLTIGINGLNQAAEYLGIECTYNESYKQLCNTIFSTIKEENAKHKTKELMFNTEFTPCESAAIKLYNRDEKDGYWVPEDTNLYASYIYKPNDPNISILDKIRLHGSEFVGDYLDGGSSAHLNLSSHLNKEQYRKILKFAADNGCKYFTFNVPNSECDDCGYITKVPITECPKCGSKNITLYDRVIGYLTAIKNWSNGRQIEQKKRIYSNA